MKDKNMNNLFRNECQIKRIKSKKNVFLLTFSLYINMTLEERQKNISKYFIYEETMLYAF